MQTRGTKGNQLELEVKAKLENLAVIDDFIIEVMKQLGIEDETFQVQLAVNEATTSIPGSLSINS